MMRNLFTLKVLLNFSIVFVLCSCSKGKKAEKQLTLYDVPASYHTSVDEVVETTEKQKLLSDILDKG